METKRLKFAQLYFPSGGLHRRLQLQNQPSYTSPELNNVWPDEYSGAYFSGRASGGKRPGLAKHYAAQISGGANKVLLVTDLVWLNSGVRTTTLLASANGLLYKYSAGNMANIGTYNVDADTATNVRLYSDMQLAAADYNQKLYITGTSGTNRKLCRYDPTTDALSTDLTPTAGTIPTKCTLICRWNGRLVLAGDLANPQVWYMSAVGDPLDFDTGSTLEGAAISAVTSPANSLGEPITALIPHSDQCLIIGCTRSTWVLRGDPARGGQLVQLSHMTGIVGGRSWCYDDNGYLYMLTLDGLYVMPPGCGQMPQSISREKLPEELLNIDRTAYTTSMAWNNRFRGVELYVTKNTASGVAQHWWIKTRDAMGQMNITFWPMKFADTNTTDSNNRDPFYVWSRRDYIPGSQLGDTVLGGRDGYLRHYYGSATDDDGTATSSYFGIGPFPLAPLGYEGILAEMQVSLGSSATIGFTVKTGETAARAYAGQYNYGSWEVTSGGLNPAHHIRARGAWCYILATASNDSGNWNLEEILIRREEAGRRRYSDPEL